MSKKRYWILAFIFSASIHAVLGGWVLSQPEYKGASLDTGELGVEVGLGLEGSYVDTLALVAADPVTQHEDTTELTDITELAKPAEIETLIEPKPIIEKQSVAVKALVNESATEHLVAPVSEQPSARQEHALLDGEVQSTAVPHPVDTLSERHRSVLSQRATGRADHSKSGGKVGSAKDYFAELMTALNRHKIYPAELKKRKKEGTVLVEFSIDRQGTVLVSSVKRSSGEPGLDRAALDMISAASPLPSIPDRMKRERLSLVIPVEYSLITH